MSTLSKPYYNSNQLLEDNSKSSFKLISSNFETPYDIAKKRQSQQPEIIDLTSDDEFDDEQVSKLSSNANIPKFEISATSKKRADYHVKLVVVGDGGSGKTCLLISYSQGKFPEAYVPTIFENYVTNVKGPQGRTVELALWDTAGQEEYDRLRPLSYPDVNILFICYAINSPISLHNVKEKWAPEVKHFCPGVPIILIGTKTDLINDTDKDQEILDFKQGEKIAREIVAQGHIRCSAKTTENINHVFDVGINTALSNIIKEEELYSKQSRKIFGFNKRSDGNSDYAAAETNYASDYHTNIEYGFTGLENNSKKGRIRRIRNHRCTIL